MTTGRRLDDIDSRLDALLAAAELQRDVAMAITGNVASLAASIDTLTENVLTLNQTTEQQGKTIETLAVGMSQLIQSSTEFHSNLSEIKELMSQQTQTTAKLVQIVEQLLAQEIGRSR